MKSFKQFHEEFKKGRPRGRKCSYCDGEGVIIPDDDRPERECGKCNGTGIIK